MQVLNVLGELYVYYNIDAHIRHSNNFIHTSKFCLCGSQASRRVFILVGAKWGGDGPL